MVHQSREDDGAKRLGPQHDQTVISVESVPFLPLDYGPPFCRPPLPYSDRSARSSDQAPRTRARSILSRAGHGAPQDRKSTRLNSSHSQISYAVFCLKKKLYGLAALTATEAPPPAPA